MRRVRALGVTTVVVPLLFIGSAPQAAAQSYEERASRNVVIMIEGKATIGRRS